MFLKTANRLLVFTLFLSALFLTMQTATAQTKDAPSQSNSPAPHGKAAAGIELLTDPEGVDFNSCLRQVYFAVRNSWYSIMPPSVEKGNQGRNSVQFRVLRDGSVPKDSVELMYHSGKDDFDTASLRAVREAAPFKPLPEKFSQPFILLRITFYYNLKPPTP
jgi:TonB family protein